MGEVNEVNEVRGLRLEGDPFELPAWKQTELMADAPPRPSQHYFTFGEEWFARILEVARTPSQWAVATVLYRECLRRKSQTVDLSNAVLKRLGVTRYAKYRALVALEKEGVLTVEEADQSHSTRATLHWFP
jgi:hypothetical protein